MGRALILSLIAGTMTMMVAAESLAGGSMAPGVSRVWVQSPKAQVREMYRDRAKARAKASQARAKQEAKARAAARKAADKAYAKRLKDQRKGK